MTSETCFGICAYFGKKGSKFSETFINMVVIVADVQAQHLMIGLFDASKQAMASTFVEECIFIPFPNFRNALKRVPFPRDGVEPPT